MLLIKIYDFTGKRSFALRLYASMYVCVCTRARISKCSLRKSKQLIFDLRLSLNRHNFSCELIFGHKVCSLEIDWIKSSDIMWHPEAQQINSNVNISMDDMEARSSSSWRVNSETLYCFQPKISNEINHFMSLWMVWSRIYRSKFHLRIRHARILWSFELCHFDRFFISLNLLLFSFLILEFHMLLTVCEVASFICDSMAWSMPLQYERWCNDCISFFGFITQML